MPSAASKPMALRVATTRSLNLRDDSIDEESRSIAGILTTPAIAQVFDWENFRTIDEIILVAGVGFDPGYLPIVKDHRSESIDNVVGQVREIAAVVDQHVGGRLFFDEPADENDTNPKYAWNKVRQRSVRAVSIGYDPDEYEDIPPGETREVDGVSYTAESRTLRITKSCTLRELSLVVIGADEAAKLRSKAMSKSNEPVQGDLLGRAGHEEDDEKRDGHEDEDEERDAHDDDEERDGHDDDEERDGHDDDEERDGHEDDDEERDGHDDDDEEREDDEDDKSRAAARPGGKRKMNATEGRVRKRARAEERLRAKVIRKLGRQGNIPNVLIDKAIDKGWSRARAGRAFYEQIVNGRSAPVGNGTPVHGGIHSPSYEKDAVMSSLAGGFAQRMGRSLIPKELPATHPDALRRQAEIQQATQSMEMGARYRDMSLLDMCKEWIRRSGDPVPDLRKDVIKRAFSSADMTEIFTTNVNAILMQTFEETEDTTQGWVREVDVMNFLTQERPLPSPFPHLAQLPRGGEAEHFTREDLVETYKVGRYAGVFVIDEQDFIDDRLDVFRDTPKEMAMAAARLKPDLVYAILLDNADLGADSVALFSVATHVNLTTAALAADAIEAGISSMAKQTRTVDGSVVNWNIKPRHLIIPQDLLWTARVLLESAQRIISANSDGTLNPLLGENIQIHADNRIGASGVVDPATGTAHTGDATNWYLAADAGVAPTIEVGYIQGSGRVPSVRSFILDEGKFGMGWDIKHDIGAKALHFAGLHKSTGAA